MKLAPKLLGPLFGLAFALVAVVAAALYFQGRSSDANRRAGKAQAEMIEVAEVRSLSRAIQRDVINFALERDPKLDQKTADRAEQMRKRTAALMALLGPADAAAMKNFPAAQNAVMQELAKAKEIAKAQGPDAALAYIRDTVRPKEKAASKLTDGFIEAKEAEVTKLIDAAASAQRLSVLAVIASAVIALVASLSVGVWAVLGGVVRPMRASITRVEKMIDGDLDSPVNGADRSDEIGVLNRALAKFAEDLRAGRDLAADIESAKKREELAARRESAAKRFGASMDTLLGSLEGAAGNLRQSAAGMSTTAEQTVERSARVAHASEAASSNVNAVAVAAEELSSSITEISRQVAGAADVASQAADRAAQTTNTVAGLQSAAERIGEVVKLISDVASQTNLLALNATIEAARAGEAGRGFAVVASEVKALAQQTAKATEEISQQIAGLQDETRNSVSAIGAIREVIETVNASAAAIAAAVEEQGAATQEIARNVQQAASGTGEVSANIGHVSEAANDTSRIAGEVNASADELTRQAQVLRDEVSAFLAEVQAA